MKRSPSENDLPRKKGPDSPEEITDPGDSPYLYITKATFLQTVSVWLSENVSPRATMIDRGDVDFWLQLVDADLQKDVWVRIVEREVWIAIHGSDAYDGFTGIALEITLYSDSYENVTLRWTQGERRDLEPWLAIQLFYWMYPSALNFNTQSFQFVPKISPS